MGRPMMHRKVQQNRRREAGAIDHLAAGLPHPAGSTLAEIAQIDAPKEVRSAEGLRHQGQATPTSAPPVPAAVDLKSLVREMLRELLAEGSSSAGAPAELVEPGSEAGTDV
jgi:hypothetical protein